LRKKKEKKKAQQQLADRSAKGKSFHAEIKSRTSAFTAQSHVVISFVSRGQAGPLLSPT
jgi:hypothetical protein